MVAAFQSRTGRSQDKTIGLIYLWIAAAFFLAGVAMIVSAFFPLCRERVLDHREQFLEAWRDYFGA